MDLLVAVLVLAALHRVWGGRRLRPGAAPAPLIPRVPFNHLAVLGFTELKAYVPPPRGVVAPRVSGRGDDPA